MAKTHSDIGLIGLAVMGQNSPQHRDHGFQISVTTARSKRPTSSSRKSLHPGGVVGTKTLQEFVSPSPSRARWSSSCKPASDRRRHRRPRALLEQGDIIIDGGNALWTTPFRREKALRERVSASSAPACPAARKARASARRSCRRRVRRVERVETDLGSRRRESRREDRQAHPARSPATRDRWRALHDYIGENGAGHYVKMVHNGIEYGDMQMICEAYSLMQGLLGLKPAEMGDIFSEWNAGALDSFLIEITADILKQKDPVTKKKRSSTSSSTPPAKKDRQMDLDQRARHGRARPDDRRGRVCPLRQRNQGRARRASKILKGPGRKYRGRKRRSLPRSTTRSTARNLLLRAGLPAQCAPRRPSLAGSSTSARSRRFSRRCIIRAAFLQKITEAYARNPDLANLSSIRISTDREESAGNWRTVVSLAAECGVAAPTFSSALSYYDSYRSARLRPTCSRRSAITSAHTPRAAGAWPRPVEWKNFPRGDRRGS